MDYFAVDLAMRELRALLTPEAPCLPHYARERLEKTLPIVDAFIEDVKRKDRDCRCPWV